ncbi:pentapeptide repeat-containing protein [Parachitinimonas caeni]|uniref:Pentapeptide repeat-containing protein n=1 Tax=Parachitinimonas caeni TaxID=3031301 RepID=A0ABT7E0U9_9NEIS|nr:pentapeptide repeat-containing protein [Parachitinimonas caeni]MDK2125943.1 pentapeptide repeat-containing protein [Parachitinimonas caeni]
MSAITLHNCEHQIMASDVNMSDSEFDECLLAYTKFEYVSFEKANFEHVRFDGAKIAKASFADVAIADSLYDGMTIEGIPVKELLRVYSEQHQPA